MTNEIELHIAERVAFAEDHAFGDTGAYERISGRAHFAVDPRAAAQATVVDLENAPVDERGLVRLAADFMILKPREMERGNRGVFYDYGNRGHKRALQFYNDAPHSNMPITLAHAGNGFFMRRGYAVAWLAWEGDMLPGDGRMVLDVPVASDNGKPITGRVRAEYIADVPGITCFPLSGRIAAHSYSTTSLDTRDAVLTRRRYPYDRPQVVPRDQWQFACTESGTGGETQSIELAVVPSTRHIHLPAGFQPGWIYELVYTAKDPLVHGLGHVAVRDFISFVKYAEDDAAGQPNPLRGVEKAYAWGRSQTGRCLRDFVYRGFNADARGRRVFDGVLPHVAGAGRKWLNHRFASPIVSGGQQYEDHFNIADSFPFSYAWSTDHLTGRQDAILKRPDTDPLVIHTQTATEYWVRRGSLAHTDTQGNDLKQPDTVRVYCWSSSQHFADPQNKPPSRGIGQNFSNVVSTSMFFRANLDAMDRWTTDGIPPPPSRIPTRADGTLVSIEEWRRQFPAIPGIATPRSPNTLPLVDFGPDVERGILKEPPSVCVRQAIHGAGARGGPRRQRRSRCARADGGGAARHLHRLEPALHAVMATVRSCALKAATSPFPDSPQEREVTGDPRAIHPGTLSGQGGLCRGGYRGRAGTCRAGVDVGGGR